MALSIDTKPLVRNYIPQLQRDLDNYAGGRKRRFQIHQVYAHATILHDALTIRRLFKEKRLRWATQTALHWQPDKDDDLDEMEVWKHLLAQTKTSPLLAEFEAVSQNPSSNATTSLFTSCTVPSPPGLASSSKSLASFRRYCIRWSILSIWGNDLSMCESAIPDVVPTAPKRPRGWWPYLELKIDGASRSIGQKPAVMWHLQFDFVDLQSPRRNPSSRPGKRRRTTVNQFHQVSTTRVQDSSSTCHLPEVKRFNGVRYRADRKGWVAEMRPSKAKNKVDFGDFKYQVEAAHAVDAAFYFYGRPELLNFPETTLQILSTIPPPAGLDEKDMKRFVKDKAKVLALMAFEFPSVEIPESSSRGWAEDTYTLGFGPDSEIASFLSCGGGDDDIFQSQPWLNWDPMTGWISNGLIMESNSVAADAGGAVMDTSEAGQVVFHCNSLNGIGDPFSCAASGSAVHITDG